MDTPLENIKTIKIKSLEEIKKTLTNGRNIEKGGHYLYFNKLMERLCGMRLEVECVGYTNDRVRAGKWLWHRDWFDIVELKKYQMTEEDEQIMAELNEMLDHCLSYNIFKRHSYMAFMERKGLIIK